MSLYFEQFTPDRPEHEVSALLVAHWSQRAGTMREITPERMAAFPYGILAFQAGTDFLAGHIAVTSFGANKNAIVGGHVTNPSLRGQGVGTAILRRLLSALPLELPDMRSCMVYVNEQSRGMYAAAGAEPVPDAPVRDVPTGCNYTLDLMPAILQALRPTGVEPDSL